MQQIVQRLELIKTAIALGDEEIIHLQRLKLWQMELDPAVCDILDAIERAEYGDVMSAIDRYNSQFNALVLWQDGEIQGLQLELRTLEVEFETLSDEKNELQFRLDKFQQQYHRRLGALIRDILELRKRIEASALNKQRRDFDQQAAAYRKLKNQLDDIKRQRAELEQQQAGCDEFSDEYDQFADELQAINDAIRAQEETLKAQWQQVKAAKETFEGSPEQQAFQEAQQEYEAFEETHQAIINEDRQALSDEEEQTLKTAFRRAARLCHPDLVSDELKEQAHHIMQALNLAKDKSDLAAVEEILFKLQNGLGFEVASSTITDKKVLRAKITELRRRIDDLHAEIAHMQASTAGKVSSTAVGCDDYLNEKEAQLRAEHQRLFQVLTDVDPDAADELLEAAAARDLSSDDENDFWRGTF